MLGIKIQFLAMLISDSRETIKEMFSKITDDEKVTDKNYIEPEINLVEKELFNINLTDESVEYKVGDHVNYNVRCQFGKMVECCYVNKERPKEPDVRCEMKLRLEDSKPFSCSPRRLAYIEKEKLQVILDEYLSEGIIRPSESEYASPTVLVKKKSGDLRLCVDNRKLNKTMVKDNYPLPLTDDLLDTLVNQTIFSKLDLKHGYFHVLVDSESIKYTSFMTPLGNFKFMRMPMGLKNAPAVFQRFINKIFADMTWTI